VEVPVARKDELGRQGEEYAAQYLTDAGYRIVARNWRCPQGEIDLVASHGDEIVFVEVKTRSSLRFGHPFEAITVAKLARLRRLAAAWCEAASESPGRPRVSRIRIDVVGVIAAPRQEPIVEHLQGVF
jgi:putative endonuclease